MALKDEVRKLLDAGYAEHEIKQAVRAAVEQQIDERHESEIAKATIPELPKAVWAQIRTLHAQLGETPKLQPFTVLQQMHAALDADDQALFLRLAILSLPKAVWAQHPGHRRSG